MSTLDIDPLLTVDDVVQIVGIPKKSFLAQRGRGEGPPAIRLGKHLRFRAEDVHTWLEERASVDA